MIWLQRLGTEHHPDIVVRPSSKTRTERVESQWRLSLGGLRLPLTPAEAIVWALMQDGHTISDLTTRLASRVTDPTKAESVVLDLITALYMRGIATLSSRGRGVEVRIRAWEPGAKRTVHFSLTSVCHLKCVHCLVPREYRHDLTTGEITSVLRDLVELGTERINFSGGEVTTRRDFFEVLSTAKDCGFLTSFNTSGTRLESLDANRYADLGVDMVAISIYGASEEVHERVTQVPGSFMRSLSAIRSLRRAGISVVLKTMMLRINRCDLSSVRALAASEGCDVVFDPYLFPTFDGSSAPLEWALPEPELTDLIADGYWPWRSKPVRKADGPICTAGDDRIAIGSNGDVYPCAVFRLPIGNLREKPIARILSESQTLLRFRSSHLADVEKCGVCKHRSSCTICPGVAYAETGDYLGWPSTACSMFSIQRNAQPLGLT